MRIIAGSHRHRSILAPADSKTTRPITDRVKENLFNRLMAMGLPSEDPGSRALDIFAGTGTLGLEALSRGIEHCTFIENDYDARNRLEQNLQLLDLADRAAIITTDALNPNWLTLLAPTPVELISVDPPYALSREAKTMQRLEGLIESLASVAEPGCALTLRTEDNIAASTIPGWHPPRTHIHGSMALHIYLRSE